MSVEMMVSLGIVFVLSFLSFGVNFDFIKKQKITYSVFWGLFNVPLGVYVSFFVYEKLPIGPSTTIFIGVVFLSLLLSCVLAASVGYRIYPKITSGWIEIFAIVILPFFVISFLELKLLNYGFFLIVMVGGVLTALFLKFLTTE